MLQEKLIASSSMTDKWIRSLSRHLDTQLMSLNVLDRDSCVIVGMSRGGLIPATYISHNTEIKNFIPYTESESDMDRIVKYINNHIEDDSKAEKLQLIVVDDIIDTGKTYSRFLFDLNQRASAECPKELTRIKSLEDVNIYMSALTSHSRGLNTLESVWSSEFAYIMFISAFSMSCNDIEAFPWVVFPWEVLPTHAE